MTSEVIKLKYCEICKTFDTCERVGGINGGIYHQTRSTLKKDANKLADYLGCNGEELYSELKPIVKKIQEHTLNKVKEVLKKQGYITSDEVQGPIKMAHGTCCCCSICGRYHDECVCESNALLILLGQI